MQADMPENWSCKHISNTDICLASKTADPDELAINAVSKDNVWSLKEGYLGQNWPDKKMTVKMEGTPTHKFLTVETKHSKHFCHETVSTALNCMSWDWILKDNQDNILPAQDANK